MSEIVILRFVHVLSATLWVGGAVFTTAFLMPVLARLGPAAGPVMAGLKDRGMLAYLPIVAALAILSGLRLMWVTSSGFSAAYFATTYGAAYGASGGLALVTFIVGMVFARPNAAKIGALAAQLGTTPDDATRATLSGQLASARRTAQVLSWVLGGLLVASAGGMAVARYLG